MQYLWDETGKQYLDGFAGIVSVSVGHCHPYDRREGPRAGRQAPAHDDDLPAPDDRHCSARSWPSTCPPGSGLSVSYFTNSGSEANEVAILSAREFTGQREVISLRNGYHGGTQAAMGLTAARHLEVQEQPDASNVKHATPGYCYRCPYGLDVPELRREVRPRRRGR